MMDAVDSTGRTITPGDTLAEATRIVRAAELANPGQMTWVYAIQAGEDGPVKVGVTNSPATRLATLQTANADELRGIAAWRALGMVEKQIHEDFAHARLRGEWFRPLPELLETITALGGEFEDWSA